MNARSTTHAAAAFGWMTAAACATRLDLPWLSDTADQTPGQAEAMAVVCAVCPVRVSCAAYVQTEAVVGGTWAGADRNLGARRPTSSRPKKPAVLSVQDPLPGLDLLGAA